MNGASCPLEIDTGLDLRLQMQLMADASTPADLTGATFEAFIRPSAGHAPLIALTVTVDDDAAGRLTVSATAAELATLTPRAAWNLLMTDSTGFKSVIVRGPVATTGVIQ